MSAASTVSRQRRQVQAAGELAHAALTRCGGVLRPLPSFPDSPYMLAGSEMVWLGSAGGIWHPRRILLAKPRQTRLCGELHVSVEGARAWHTPSLPRIASEQLAFACAAITSDIAALGTPAGFGALLAGEALRFPLDLALSRVRALADAVARDDAAAFEVAALPLLGLGPGLTPSGDDCVGACLFARRLRGFDSAWNEAAQSLVHAAPGRSNCISAALFGDLARGAAYAPLHQLAAAMAGDTAGLLGAARALTAIGHSSGWDMLTGFILGAGGAIDWKFAPDVAFKPMPYSISALSSRA